MAKTYQPISLSPVTEWRTRFTYFISAMMLVAAVVVGDYLLFGRSLLEKGAPHFDVQGLARAVGCGAVAFLFFQSLKPDHRIRYDRSVYHLRHVATAMTILMFSSAAAVGIFPRSLNSIVREGQLVGFITDVVLIVALLHFAIAFRTARRAPAGFGRIFGLSAPSVIAVMFAIVFLILMEEMSWGQHLFGWSAGGLFESNAQNETNLHNFYTYQFEAVYYSTAFIAFVVLPWSWPENTIKLLQPLSLYIPPKIFAAAALPVAGFLYEEWNLVAYQVWFVGAVLIGLHITVNAKQDTQLFRLTSTTVAVMLAAQAIFLIGGHRMIDGYELSEIRELGIAGMIAAYGMIVARRFALAAEDRSGEQVPSVSLDLKKMTVRDRSIRGDFKASVFNREHLE